MPGSARREQAGARTRAPSTSTTQSRQAFDRRQRLEVAERRDVDAGRRGRRRGGSRPPRPRPPCRRSRSRPSPAAGAAAASGDARRTRRRREPDRVGVMIPLPVGSLGHRGPSETDRTAPAPTRWRWRRSGRGRRSRRRASPARARRRAPSPGRDRRSARRRRRRCRSSSWRTVPTRQGTHWPHDSWRKNSAMRSSASPRSAVVAVDQHDARAERGAGGAGAFEGERQRRAGPGRRSCRRRRRGAPRGAAAVEHAAGELEQLAERRAERQLVETGPVHLAGEAEELRAGRLGGAGGAERLAALEQDPAGTLASVSTLLTSVGLPKTPTSTGNGGFERGSPRWPSIELKSAVSSPQM